MAEEPVVEQPVETELTDVRTVVITWFDGQQPTVWSDCSSVYEAAGMAEAAHYHFVELGRIPLPNEDEDDDD